jgi:hypothetical protein
MKPTFIGIGAQKCASTWLYDILADHPQVFLNAQKEIDFFSYFYDYGFQWYERHFKCTEEKLAAGEVSPSYFHGLSVPKRVYDYDPDARLILFLRNPIERAISNHKHEVRTAHLQGNDLSFEYGLANNPSYIEQGLYASHLERWLAYFPQEQILIILVEDITADPAEVAKLVYGFLGVNKDHEPEALHQRSNVSYANRSAWLETGKNSVRAAFRKLRLGWVWEAVGSAGFQRLYRIFNRRESEAVIPPMKESTKQMLQKRFCDETLRLEKLIDRSLKSWM